MEKIILMTKDERIKMGYKGREKIKQEFIVDLVIEKYKKTIKEIL